MSWYGVGFPSFILALGRSSVKLRFKQEEHLVVSGSETITLPAESAASTPVSWGGGHPYPFRMRSRFDHVDDGVTVGQLWAIDRNRLVRRLGESIGDYSE